MKYSGIIAGILFVLFLMTVTACGGGGTSGSNGTTSGTFSSIRMEAVTEGTNTPIDPSNVFVNEIIRFRLTGVDSGTNTRVVIPTSNYNLTGSPDGALDSTGMFTASSSSSGNIGVVHVTFDTISYQYGVKVVVPQAVIKGFARTTEGFPGTGVQVNALNSGGTVVGSGFVASDGTIRFSTSATAVKFTTNFGIVDPGPNLYYVRQFAYGGKDYSTTITTCTAPLPSLTNGVTTNLATTVVFYRNASGFPPPPPDGCQ